jgi:hypothetical protein
MIKLRKSIVAAAVVGTTLLGAGTAYAFVVAKGHGKGEAKVATPAFTMTVTPGTIPALLPGRDATALPVTVKNTSQSSIQIKTVTVSISETCANTITIVQPKVQPTVLKAGETETFDGAALGMADSQSVDQTACMGASLTIDASVNGG